MPGAYYIEHVDNINSNNNGKFIFNCRNQGLHYMAFRFWIGMWMCVLLLIMVAFDLSALVRFITRFTEECFAMLIAVIFIYEAFKKLIHILDKAPVDLHPLDIKDYNCTCLPPFTTPESNMSFDLTSGNQVSNMRPTKPVLNFCFELYICRYAVEEV